MIPSQQFSNEKSFAAYKEYLALKRHFTSKYDYHKYNGKTNVAYSKFVTRKDVYFFYKLSQKQDITNRIVAMMIKNPNVWIRDICEEDGEDAYLQWRKRTDGLSYHIKSDLSKLKENYADNFAVSDGQHPYILTLYLQKKISLETLTIMAKLAVIMKHWRDEIKDKIVAGKILDLIENYEPFLEFDKKKIVELVKNHFDML